MGLRYWRHGAAALVALLILFTAAAGTVLAVDPQADDVVFDGVVSVHWTDTDHGPMAGAIVRIFYFHDGDEFQGIVPLGDPLDANGDAVISAVPRPAAGAAPLLLDIFADLQTSTIDDAGCTRLEGWSAQRRNVPADTAVDVSLETSARSLSVNCPNLTPRPASEVFGFPPTGTVLGATGRPQITPPATDATIGSAEAQSETPFLPLFLALVALAVVVVPAGSLGLARARMASRRRRSRRERPDRTTAAGLGRIP